MQTCRCSHDHCEARLTLSESCQLATRRIACYLTPPPQTADKPVCIPREVQAGLPAHAGILQVLRWQAGFCFDELPAGNSGARSRKSADLNPRNVLLKGFNAPLFD